MAYSVGVRASVEDLFSGTSRVLALVSVTLEFSPLSFVLVLSINTPYRPSDHEERNASIFFLKVKHICEINCCQRKTFCLKLEFELNNYSLDFNYFLRVIDNFCLSSLLNSNVPPVISLYADETESQFPWIKLQCTMHSVSKVAEFLSAWFSLNSSLLNSTNIVILQFEPQKTFIFLFLISRIKSFVLSSRHKTFFKVKN